MQRPLETEGGTPAAGSLTGDDSLKNEGKADQAKAPVKDKVDKAAGKAKDLLDRDK